MWGRGAQAGVSVLLGGRGGGSQMHCLVLTTSPCPRSGSGRTSFYEEYGVIRDVIQNHLTEILTLVAMELPGNVSSPEAVLQHKLQAFQALRGLQKSSAVVGQYQAYSQQVRRELQKPDSFHSLTPTFAGVLWGRAAGLWGCWAAPHPQVEAALPAQMPVGLGWKGLEAGFSQECSGGVTIPQLSGLPPAAGSRSPAGALQTEVTLVMMSVQSMSTDASRARPAGLRPGLALVERTSSPQGVPQTCSPQLGASPAGTHHAGQADAHWGRPLGSSTGSELPGGGWLPHTNVTAPTTRAAAACGALTGCLAPYMNYLIESSHTQAPRAGMIVIPPERRGNMRLSKVARTCPRSCGDSP